MNGSSEIGWDASVWKEINDAVLAEVGKVRIAQKVFPTTVFDNNPEAIPNEVINFPGLTITEGQFKSFVEIYQEFPLTSTQVKKEPESKICKTLARMAAKSIGLAEDIVIFQGDGGVLPPNVCAALKISTANGLLGAARPADADDAKSDKVSNPICINLLAGRPGVLYGEKTFAAVADGIAKLVAKAQAPNYALFLPTKAYADTFAPPSDKSLVTTADRIRPLVEGGFYGTGTLPPDKGLLVAMGGEPTTLYVSREASTEFIRKDNQNYIFRVVERIQFVARDPRAFVLLEFEQPKGAPAPAGKIP